VSSHLIHLKDRDLSPATLLHHLIGCQMSERFSSSSSQSSSTAVRSCGKRPVVESSRNDSSYYLSLDCRATLTAMDKYLKDLRDKNTILKRSWEGYYCLREEVMRLREEVSLSLDNIFLDKLLLKKNLLLFF